LDHLAAETILLDLTTSCVSDADIRLMNINTSGTSGMRYVPAFFEVKIMEIVLGNGCVSLTTVERNGRKGVLLEQTCEPHDINSIPSAASGATQANSVYQPKESDVIIWVDNLESARVLQDIVSRLCLELNGYCIGDINEGIGG